MGSFVSCSPAGSNDYQLLWLCKQNADEIKFQAEKIEKDMLVVACGLIFVTITSMGKLWV